ncbi:TPA: RusA family crossover junction endodeoxyribonuclease [Escherichia coli]|nr:putative Crossover junction endodeoxyribonuclease [Escherichia coli]HAI1998154.1 RusA family crossover junction endodeoxyribonuclease [Escherichia coli]
MSTKLTGYVWDGCAASGMKLSSVAIMARLADFSNDEGVCWPSIETIARQIGAGMPKPTSAPASVEIVLFPPDNRIRDLDNYNKALFDALTHAGVWEDDSQVKRMLVEWGPVIPEGKVEITISKYEKTAGAAA